MKILFICENYLPHYGGAEVVFKNLAESYAIKGHNVALLTHQIKGTKKREEMGAVKVIRVPSFNSRYIFSFSAILKAIKLAKHCDVIQTTTFNGTFPAWIAAKVCRKPIVITVHEVWVNKWRKVTSFPRWKCFIHDLLERAIYLLPYDQYVCVSNATKKDLLKLGINENKVKTIYNGLDYNFWNKNNFSDKKVQEIKEQLNLKKKVVYYASGRPGESKGFETFIKAIPLIKSKVPNSFFLLALGSVEKYKRKHLELLALIKNLRIEKEIKVMNSVPYEELGHYLKAANYVVVPSLAEGFGYTTVEAVAMEKPVIVSNAGSLPEVVSGKHLIFKKGSPIDLAEKAIQTNQGQYEKSKMKKFLWQNSVQSYLRVYERLLNRF